MARNWYRAQKVSDKEVLFVNEKTKQFFRVMLDSNNIVAVSQMFFHLPEETGKKLTMAEQETLFQNVKTFIVSEIGDYSCDGYPIRVCHSGAGYYIGCYCEDGPYCRISEGYSDFPEEAWCYLYENYALSR